MYEYCPGERTSLVEKIKIASLSIMYALLLSALAHGYTDQKTSDEDSYDPSAILRQGNAVAQSFNGKPALVFTTEQNSKTVVVIEFADDKPVLAFPMTWIKGLTTNIGPLRIDQESISFSNQSGSGKFFSLQIGKIKSIRAKVIPWGRHMLEIKAEDKEYNLYAVYEPALTPFGSHQQPLLRFIAASVRDFSATWKIVDAMTKDLRKELAANEALSRAKMAEYLRGLESAIKDGEEALRKIVSLQSESARNALRILKRLDAATEIGINRQDYGNRLIDAKVDFDEHLGNVPQSIFRDELSIAFQAYLDAAQAWNQMGTYDFLLVNTPLGHSLVQRWQLKVDNTGNIPSLPKETLLNQLWLIGKTHARSANEILNQSKPK